jgi:hypothetical protein
MAELQILGGGGVVAQLKVGEHALAKRGHQRLLSLEGV